MVYRFQMVTGKQHDAFTEVTYITSLIEDKRSFYKSFIANIVYNPVSAVLKQDEANRSMQTHCLRSANRPNAQHIPAGISAAQLRDAAAW